jgi:CBS domain-containing protein
VSCSRLGLGSVAAGGRPHFSLPGAQTMKTVRELLQRKGYEVWSIGPDNTVFDALKLMADKNVGALLVIDADKLMGVLSERDYARKVILVGKSSKDTSVRDIMSTKVVHVEPDLSLEGCMVLMTERHVRHLPVLDGDHLIGVISIGDVVNAVIAEQKFIIDQLKAFHAYDM